MKHLSFLTILFFILLGEVACVSENSPGGTARVPSPAQVEPIDTSSGMGSFFAIDEVGLGQEGYVTLTNFTSVPASLAGLVLCQESACFPLPDVAIPAGQQARITTGDGSAMAGVVVAGATLGMLEPADGEIALFAAADKGQPGTMLAYFQWGSTPHQTTEMAVEAGLWIAGGYGPSSAGATRLFKEAESGLWLFDAP